MERRRTRFSRINLTAADITRMRIVVFYDWSDERAAILKDAFNPEGGPEETVSSVVRYKPQGSDASYVRILAVLFMFRPPGEAQDTAPELALSVAYEPTGATERRADPARIPEAQFLDLVGGLGEPAFLYGNIDYFFQGRGGDDLWFPLPTQLAGKRTTSDLFEITGVEGRKVAASGSDERYDFRLECANGSDVTLAMSMYPSGQFDGSLPRRLVDQASRRVPDLVPRKSKGG